MGAVDPTGRVIVVGGSANATRIQGRNVSSTAPTDTQVFTWNEAASQWEPADGGGGGAYQSVPDTGWTDTGTVTHVAGVCSLGVVASGDAAALRATPVDPLAPGVELVGRLDYTTGAPATDAWTYLAITNATRDRGYLVQATYLGEVQMYSNVAGGGWAFATGTGGGAIDLTANTAWLRLVVTPSYVAVYYATGASRPARDGWTRLGSAAINTELLSTGALDRVMLGAGRSGAGAGTYTVAWSDVAYRALLGLVA